MKVLVNLLIAFSLASCAPGIEDSLGVDRVPQPEHGTESLSGRSLSISTVSDSRPSDFVGEINGRKVKSNRNVGVVVREALESYFKAEGAKVVMFDAPARLNVDVKELYVVVTPGFPTSTAEAKAKIELELSAKNGSKFIGKYAASTTVEHPILDQARIEQALGDALGEAASRASRDPKLWSVLN